MSIPGVKTFFGSLRLRTKFSMVFIFLSLMMLIGGAVGYYNAVKVSSVAKHVYTGAFTWFESLTRIESELLAQRQELLIHVGLDDNRTKAFLKDSMVSRREKIDTRVKELRDRMTKEEDKALIDALSSNLLVYWKAENSVLALSEDGKKQLALRAEVDTAKPAFNAAYHMLGVIIEEEKQDVISGYHQSEYVTREIMFVTIAITVMALIVAFGLWWALSISIARPIMLIGEAARKMAAGDLEQRADVSVNDEIGELAVEFNKMSEALQFHYENLESQVAERTEALKAANAELLLSKKEMESVNEELVKASRMKSQFLANVSHELRTPLNSIIGFSELLQEPAFGTLNEKQSQYVQYINGSGSHLLQLINSILDLSKIEAGKMELSPENVVLVDALNEILATIRPLAQKRNIRVHTKSAPASPIISVDKGKFKQIMLNLLSNAVKFNIDGGTVDVDWDIKEEVKGTEVGNYLYLSVRDTGIGIKEGDMSKLFREFEQLDASVTREYGGTGLGLSLTKKLVELHGGEIKGEGEEGKGCKFTIRLPQRDVKLELIKSPGALAGYGGSGSAAVQKPVIIVCAESKDINRLVSIYLGESGFYDIVTVDDGGALIAEVKKKKPFAIVMGIAIPGRDGWEVLRELKNSADTRNVPIVIVSSHNNKDLGFALGAVDYIDKPVDKEQLMETLGRLSYMSKNTRKRQTILVVDDEPQVLTLLDDILTNEGFNVLKAGGGRDAIEIAINSEPDLMILDLMMPEVSGFDVVDKLKDHPIAKHIPIVLFTAKEITEEDKVRLGDGIEKIIRKAGFSMEQLVSELRLLEMAFPEKANMIDGFTKAFNKRYLDVMLPREISRSERYGHNFSLLAMDIDDFSVINSKYGKDNGDAVIQELSVLLKALLRKADVVARTGVDEFVVFLPDIGANEAMIVADKVRSALKTRIYGGKVPDGSVTVSMGLITCPVHAKTELITKALSLVRSASEAGGNALCVAKKD